MTAPPKKLTYPEIFKLLLSLVKGGKTATMYIRSEDGKAAAFEVQEGKLIGLYYGTTRGSESIALIRNIREGSPRLDAKVLALGATADLPDTKTLLYLLKPESAPMTETSAATENSAGTPAFDSEAVVAIVKKILRRYIGPYADIICEECGEKLQQQANKANLHKMLDELARELDSEEEAARFMDEARKELADYL